jgi:hypothetical protein
MTIYSILMATLADYLELDGSDIINEEFRV